MAQWTDQLHNGIQRSVILAVLVSPQHLAQYPVSIGGDTAGHFVRRYTQGSQGMEYRWDAGFVTFALHQS